MRHFFMLFACLAWGALNAETIGNVEYHLPNQGKGWKIVNELKTTKNRISTTIIYVPEKTSKKNSEFFGVHQNTWFVDLNAAALENSIKAQYPNQEINFLILEETPQSVLYEWSVREEEEAEEGMHGWTRIFSFTDETIILSYQTKQILSVDKVGPLWVKILKNAKVANSALR